MVWNIVRLAFRLDWIAGRELDLEDSAAYLTRLVR